MKNLRNEEKYLTKLLTVAKPENIITLNSSRQRKGDDKEWL
jgi:hypothetical protein